MLEIALRILNYSFSSLNVRCFKAWSFNQNIKLNVLYHKRISNVHFLNLILEYLK